MYQLDTQSAKSADTIGAFINDTGKYIGAFIRAEKLLTDKQTHGIGFTFKADDGRETRFDLYTVMADGTKLYSMKQVHALMACLQARNLTEQKMRVKKWDKENSKEDMLEATCFPELMNKPIGLLLRAEEYEKMKNGQLTGESGWRMGLFACFQAGTELMASEILDRKTQPEQLAKVTAMLADKPLKKSPKSAPDRPQGSQSSMAVMDDDIPF